MTAETPVLRDMPGPMTWPPGCRSEGNFHALSGERTVGYALVGIRPSMRGWHDRGDGCMHRFDRNHKQAACMLIWGPNPRSQWLVCSCSCSYQYASEHASAVWPRRWLYASISPSSH